MRDAYYEFFDMYRNAVLQDDRIKSVSPVEILGHLASKFYVDGESVRLDIKEASRNFGLIMGQSFWYSIGKPYCKVYPSMVEMLRKTSIKIPSIQVPFPFPAFAIRFSSKDPFTDNNGGPPLRSVLVSGRFKGRADPNNYKITLPNFWDYGKILLCLDFGETFKVNNFEEKAYSFMILELNETLSLEESFEKAMQDVSTKSGYFPDRSFQKDILSVAISTAFFMCDQHELVCPDLPKRCIDIGKRAERSKGRQKKEILNAIEKQQKKLDHYGWTIGKEIELPRPLKNKYGDSGDRSGEKRGELHFSHIRSQHQRWQQYGEKAHPKYKLIFLPPVQVRPDLPMKQHSGFRITGRK